MLLQPGPVMSQNRLSCICASWLAIQRNLPEPPEQAQFESDQYPRRSLLVFRIQCSYSIFLHLSGNLCSSAES